jgi:hypothetical protein
MTNLADSLHELPLVHIFNDGNATSPNFGHVRIYDLIATVWAQVGGYIDGERMSITRKTERR